MRKIEIAITAGVLFAGMATATLRAFAWGDEGHEIVALVAQSYLDPAVKKKVEALLAADTDNRTPHDIASEATWADKIKSDSALRQQTSQWHFIDIELANPNIDQACFNHPPVPPGKVASNGPAADCITDKIDEFAAELANPATDPEERVAALKFLLHFVGDLHQPLHSSDDHDRGGNDKHVSARGIRSGNLHHYWDTEFVVALGNDPRQVSADLIESISDVQAKDWARGTPTDWAKETFALARSDAYGQLPQPNAHHKYQLTDEYVEMATTDASTQLSKAGVRLAFILNTALARNQ